MTGTKKQTNVMIMTITIFIATFMTAIEGTIVSTAMPTIVGSLHGVKLMNWVFSIYLLTSAMATPIYGKMADRIGRKPILLMGLGIFVLGSLLSGLSQSMLMLIIFRAIQGIGAGAIMPVTFTIIADIYPLEKRAKVLGFNGSAWGIASVVAPLLGGFIVDQLSWHWVFALNVPIGIVTMLLTWVYLQEDFDKQHGPVDYLGTGLLAFTLMFTLLGFQMLSEAGGVMKFGLMLVLAVIFLTLFVRQERRAADPVISLDLFKNRTFTIQNLLAALVSGIVMGFEVYMPMWMQGILGESASLGGFVVTPSSLMWVMGSFVAGRMIAKMKVQHILAFALIDILVGVSLLVLMPITGTYPMFLGVAAVVGFGFGIAITTTTVSSQTAVDHSQMGVATSFNTLSRTLGQTLMVSVFGIIFNMAVARGLAQHRGLNMDMMNLLVNSRTAHQLPHETLAPLRDVLYSGFHGVYIVCALVAIVAIICNLFDRDKNAA